LVIRFFLCFLPPENTVARIIVLRSFSCGFKITGEKISGAA